MDQEELKRWIAERARKDDALYERYGKHLEAQHKGRFVAISDEGELLLGDDDLTLGCQAIDRFGRGKFALRRIGYDYDLRWRQLWW